ncbi:MAG: acyl-CoA dehydrogenase family protein, partial [Alphaproteobacteria bacterium]
MTYTPPIRDMAFALDHIADLPRLAQTGAFPEFTPDLTQTVLGGAGRLAAEVIAPLNRTGDLQGTRLIDGGEVRTAEGFARAYRQFVDAGWGGLCHPPQWGGQGLPRMLSFAVLEMMQAANVSWGLCPMLTQGAVEALIDHGTEELQRLYLPRLVSGEWPGTMNLTEPQAGSDVGALKTRAEPLGGGAYRITGTKIYITWGEHDMAENIVHLVLARLPDAPPGTRGVSLFLVPKFLVNPDGSLGERNDVFCVGLEKKLGIHGSPTCVMAYGEKGGATGWLIGEENRGMACMFTMMNNARLAVGLQGVAVGEAAYQAALAFARERRQGKPYGRQHEAVEALPIIEHPDVRRMLMTMKAKVEAARAICYANAAAIDLARSLEDEAGREAAKAREDLLTPVSKAFSTDLGVEIASTGIQVHGGMGYIEETGAAQFLRDARIAPIYEGTNGIQALDLVNRKLPM